MPASPKKALTIGTPMNEVLPRGTTSISTPVVARSQRQQEERVAAEELEETRSYILGVFPYTVQSLEGVAHRLREIAVHDLPLDHWDRYPAELQAVEIDDVQRVAQAHLRPAELTVVAVGPEAEHRPQLEPFGEEELTQIALGDVLLKAAGRVPRCPVPARDVASGRLDRGFAIGLVEAKAATRVGQPLERGDLHSASVYTRVLTPGATLKLG